MKKNQLSTFFHYLLIMAIIFIIMFFFRLDFASATPVTTDGLSTIELKATNWKDFVGIIEGIVTSLAIIIGGLWAVNKLFIHREIFPRARLSHRLTQKELKPNQILIHLTLRISNVGNVLISLARIVVKIQHVLPLVESLELEDFKIRSKELNFQNTRIPWHLIAKRSIIFNKGEIEIGPNNEVELEIDLIIKNICETIAIYTFAENEKKRDKDMGWSKTTYHDIKYYGKS